MAQLRACRGDAAAYLDAVGWLDEDGGGFRRRAGHGRECGGCTWPSFGPVMGKLLLSWMALAGMMKMEVAVMGAGCGLAAGAVDGLVRGFGAPISQ